MPKQFQASICFGIINTFLMFPFQTRLTLACFRVPQHFLHQVDLFLCWPSQDNQCWDLECGNILPIQQYNQLTKLSYIQILRSFYILKQMMQCIKYTAGPMWNYLQIIVPSQMHCQQGAMQIKLFGWSQAFYLCNSIRIESMTDFMMINVWPVQRNYGWVGGQMDR